MNLLRECAVGASTTELQILKCAAMSFKGDKGQGFTTPDVVAQKWYNHYLQFGIEQLPPFVHQYLERTSQVLRAVKYPVAA